MFAVIRKYKGATALIEALATRREEIQSVMVGVTGLISYRAVRTADDGLVTITICQTEAGAQESTQRAAAWVRENLPALALEAPEVTSGTLFVELSGQGV